MILGKHETSECRALIDSPIFILGAGRSGTTLLRSLLSAHSRISITPETHFMKTAELFGGLQKGVPSNFESFWSRYTSQVRFRDLGVSDRRCREFVEKQGDRSYRSIFNSMLAAYGERVGKIRIGEKTPGHIYYLHYLTEWFPTAQLIVIQRDPRAVVASQLKTPWVAQQYLRKGRFRRNRLYQIAYYAKEWSKIYGEILPEWKNDFRIATVHYEDLVQDVESEVRTLCDFLGEDYEPTMVINRTGSTVPVAAGKMENSRFERWRRKHEEKTLHAVSTDSLEKWRKGLRRREIAMVEGCCFKGSFSARYAPTTLPFQRVMWQGMVNTVMGLGWAEAKAFSAVNAVFHRNHSNYD